jgi:hypothetical protein
MARMGDQVGAKLLIGHCQDHGFVQKQKHCAKIQKIILYS